MKNRELIKLQQNLLRVDPELKGVKLAYAIHINLKRLQPVVDALRNGLKEYDKKLQKINVDFSQKDEQGNVKIEDFNFVLQEDKIEDYKSAIKELELTYTDDLAEYKSLLDEEAVISIHKINIKDVPADISIHQLRLISGIIQDEEESPAINDFKTNGSIKLVEAEGK